MPRTLTQLPQLPWSLTASVSMVRVHPRSSSDIYWSQVSEASLPNPARVFARGCLLCLLGAHLYALTFGVSKPFTGRTCLITSVYFTGESDMMKESTSKHVSPCV